MQVELSEEELVYVKDRIRSQIVEDTKLLQTCMGAEAQDSVHDNIDLGWDIFKKLCEER